MVNNWISPAACWQCSTVLISLWLTHVCRSHPKTVSCMNSTHSTFWYKCQVKYLLNNKGCGDISHLWINISHPLETLLSGFTLIFVTNYETYRLNVFSHECYANLIYLHPKDDEGSCFSPLQLQTGIWKFHVTGKKKRKSISSLVASTKVWLNMRGNCALAVFECAVYRFFLYPPSSILPGKKKMFESMFIKNCVLINC